MEELHTIALVVGDWSADGHGRTDTVVIRSSLGMSDIEEAYRIGCGIVGFDFRSEVCCDYDDPKLPAEKLALLEESGFDRIKRVRDGLDPYFENTEEAEDESGDWYLDSFAFAEIFLFVTSLGAPAASFERIDVPQVNVGGYGLFVS